MNSFKVLHIDQNHPLILEQLEAAGFQNDTDYTFSKKEIEQKIHLYDGIIIRSRFFIDKEFIDKAINLKFIARVGAGLESIDTEYAQQKGIEIIASPEGNANAVGEHALGLLLNLLNKLNIANQEVKNGQWKREENRGYELEGKTVAIIGYGKMGKSFAKKLKGFDCQVIFHDIVDNLSDENAQQVTLEHIFEHADVLSLHTPWTPLTDKMINNNFINQFKKPFWFINTARGKSVVTSDLVNGLKSGKILGAGLDVLEYEKLSFESINESEIPQSLQYLYQAKNVVLTPHIAGWSYESKVKLAQIIVDKIKSKFKI